MTQPPTDQGVEAIWHRELRGKTVTPEQQHILDWAEARLRWPLSEFVARERKAAAKEARQQALTDFAEFCHERYLGCGQNNSSPTGLDYSYSGEVVTMAEAYLDHTTPNQQETKHE